MGTGTGRAGDRDGAVMGAGTGRGGAGMEGVVKRGWWPLAVIASAHLMAVLDTTVMFVALPSVQRGLA